MTPLINEFVSDIYQNSGGNLDPADLMWFDASGIITETISLSAEVLDNPLPFQYTAFVCQTVVEPLAKVLVMLSSNPPIKVDGIICHAFLKSVKTGQVVRLPDFYYKVKDGEVDVTYFIVEGKKIREISHEELDEQSHEYTNTTAAIIGKFLESLSQGSQYYVPAKRPNHLKRLRQGKVPMFDWKTVVIEPSKPKREHQGGTHASPRLHDRRGHWRVMKKSGKKVWVRNCKVGDPSRGIIFHDYKMKDAE